ncbi:DUF445 domain-containing protein [Calidifontibacter sp. DB0510]|uniref:DUF445 domain-containing protein n=2 Tax=Metallococcus carri TaxID=1656884 RepID=A0A967AZN4_9MICO|nr:DUF445 domain-containing protein [Metallococcus carri]NOP37482.1 DUF445 domain-containing protein [Calidifontibacter sp. DB2511S]
MRAVALSLLLLAAVIFVLTHGRGGVWGYVNAASEAAMVGAVADWFAVTALFRRPLGLPIPHTAIIPERKQTIARSLEDFVTDNFLTADNVRTRLQSAEVMLRVGRWLQEPANARRAVAEASPALARGVSSVKDSEVAELLDRILLPRLGREPIAPLAGSLLEGVVRDGSHRGLVDLGVTQLHDWVIANEETVSQILATRAPWWSPKSLDDIVIRRVHAEMVTWLADVRDNPDHRVREALDEFLRELAGRLQTDPDTQAKAEALKLTVLEHPSVAGSLVSLWGSVRRALVEALGDEDGELRARMARALGDLGGRIVTDASFRASLDRRLADAVVYMVTTYGRELSTVISQTIDRWDGREASQRIELHVGRDLQFIRINGTVVGGLVGLLIYTLAQLL